jgi:hypothetical protein
VSAFYLAFLVTVLAGLGARDQVTIATLSRRQRGRPGVVLCAVIVSFATAAFAAWASAYIAPLLSMRARLVMAAIALGFAAGEALWPFAAKRMDEPTASLGALGIVLLAHQLTDAARFLIFALGVVFAAPVAAGLGGAAGGAVSVALAWLLPDAFGGPRLRLARRAIGVVLLLAAAVVFFQARTL